MNHMDYEYWVLEKGHPTFNIQRPISEVIKIHGPFFVNRDFIDIIFEIFARLP